jgi:hypothetical protein
VLIVGGENARRRSKIVQKSKKRKREKERRNCGHY